MLASAVADSRAARWRASLLLRARRPAARAPAAAAIGVGSVGLSALVAAARRRSASSTRRRRATAFTPGRSGPGWTSAASRRSVAFYLDALSLVMMLRGHRRRLPHPPLLRPSTWPDDEGYSRFFAYMNLFVASMLILVLADNLLLLYLGWEGVGLCSYLLIGFWYKDPANGRAARKAFIVTRVGDTAHGRRAVPALHAAWARCDIQDADAAARRSSGRSGSAHGGGGGGAAAGRGAWASRRSCRCRRGCPTRWPARRRSAR